MFRALALVAVFAAIALTTVSAEAKIPRSRTAIAEFKQQQPCPATGRSRGPCPGWQIDHADPLKCGGLDAPVNMQWLTVEEHKAKTSRESGWCRR